MIPEEQAKEIVDQVRSVVPEEVQLLIDITGTDDDPRWNSPEGRVTLNRIAGLPDDDPFPAPSRTATPERQVKRTITYGFDESGEFAISVLEQVPGFASTVGQVSLLRSECQKIAKHMQFGKRGEERVIETVNGREVK